MGLTEHRKRNIFYLKTLIFVWCFAESKSQCPDQSAIAPCICEEVNGLARQLSCRGTIGLSRLTTILRSEMCGRSIGKFELIDSDVGYLPSNLFYKTIVKDIQVSFTNISHFTRAGRSAFYGLERHLASLSMRRCQLVGSLQWQMIGDLEVLSYLDLSYNHLTGVPKQWFWRPPPNLLSLILKGNRIARLESGALSQMHKLIELDLSENEIVTLSREVFPHPGNALLFLRLNDNHLRALPDNLFDEMLGLRRMYLDNNRLTTLPGRVWMPIWGDLEHLNLDGNHLECGCNMLWVAELRPPKHLYGECSSKDSGRLSNTDYNNAELFSSYSQPSSNNPIILPNDTIVINNNTGIKLRDLEIYNFELCNLEEKNAGRRNKLLFFD